MTCCAGARSASIVKLLIRHFPSGSVGVEEDVSLGFFFEPGGVALLDLLGDGGDGLGDFEDVGGDFVDHLPDAGLDGDDELAQLRIEEGLEGSLRAFGLGLVELGLGGFSGAESLDRVLGDLVPAHGGEEVGGEAVQVLAAGDLRDLLVLLVVGLAREPRKARADGAGEVGAGDALRRICMSFSSGTEGCQSMGLEWVLSRSHTPTASTMTKRSFAGASGVRALRSSAPMIRTPRPFICSK